MISFFGSLFLFVYWPTFNAALSAAGGQKRALINTYLSIASSALSAAAFSRLQYGKLDVFVIQNASLAGGVAIGASCDLISNMGITLLIGALSGMICTFGVSKLDSFL